MKRPVDEVMGQRLGRRDLRRPDVAGQSFYAGHAEVASFRDALPAIGADAAEVDLRADFVDFLAGDHALLCGERSTPDPVYREKLRSSLWRTFVMARGFDDTRRH